MVRFEERKERRTFFVSTRVLVMLIMEIKAMQNA